MAPGSPALCVLLVEPGIQLHILGFRASHKVSVFPWSWAPAQAEQARTSLQHREAGSNSSYEAWAQFILPIVDSRDVEHCLGAVEIVQSAATASLAQTVTVLTGALQVCLSILCLPVPLPL